MRKMLVGLTATCALLLTFSYTNNEVQAFQSSPFTTSPLEGTPKDGKCRPGEFECSNRQVCVKEGERCLACPEGYSYERELGCYKCGSGTSLKKKNGSWVCE